MSASVTRYARVVIVVGAILFLTAIAGWDTRSLPLAGGYLALAALASTFKVRLPGLDGTVSPGFAVLLGAVVELGWSETAALAAVCGVIQCLWHAQKRPAAIQVAFNAAAMVISSGAAYQIAHGLIADNAPYCAVARLAVATPALFAANTLLVAMLLSLLEGRSAFGFWRKLHLWTFPHYLLGGVTMTGLWFASMAAGLALPWLSLPILYLQFSYQRESIGVNRQAV